MINLKGVPQAAWVTRHLLRLIFFAVVLLMLPAAALADEPGYEGPQKCAECHQAETEAWQTSPHAQALKPLNHHEDTTCAEEPGSEGCACLSCHTTDFDPAQGTFTYGGVTCEACHGAYVEGHPQNGVMQLDVDSSVCQECHVDTHQEWLASSHGEANVQCISCHLSHSQEFRLTDENLCGSCHRDHVSDFAHAAHHNAGITCTNCHLSSPASADSTTGGAAPSHSFAVSSDTCVTCHGQTIHEEEAAPAAPVSAPEVAQASLAPAPGAPAQELVAKLEMAEHTNDTLKAVSVTSLGLGIGIGGMLGIILMLVFGCIGRRREK